MSHPCKFQRKRCEKVVAKVTNGLRTQPAAYLYFNKIVLKMFSGEENYDLFWPIVYLISDFYLVLYIIYSIISTNELMCVLYSVLYMTKHVFFVLQ